MPAFSKKEALSFGWNTFRSRWVFFVGVSLLMVVGNVVPGAVTGFLPEDQTVGIFMVSLLGWVLTTVISIGMVKVMLVTVDGGRPKLLDVFDGYRPFFKFLFTTFLAGLLSFLGVLLLIIPGIYIGIRLQFSVYLVIDKGTGPITAVKESWRMTKGSVVNILLLDIILGVVSLVGVLALGVGLLLTIPFTMLSMAWVYRKLVLYPPK